MQNKILQEIKELKRVISILIGTSDFPSKDQFSHESVVRASREFQKLNIERGEWIEDDKISKYIRNAHYRSGTFIRERFGFANYFKRGHTYYYNKKDIIALAKELKERNVDLGRYIEYIEDREKFKKYLASMHENNKGKRKKKSFQLPANLKDITATPIPTPSAEIIRDDIKKLRDEFFEYHLSDYIDIYLENHAVMKFIYHFEKYLEPGLKKRCKRWCENFNYANHALEEITKKKETFIPVKEEDMQAIPHFPVFGGNADALFAEYRFWPIK